MICRQCLRAASRGSAPFKPTVVLPFRRTLSSSPSSLLSQSETTSAPAATAAAKTAPTVPASSTATTPPSPAATVSGEAKPKAARGTPGNAPISISSVPAGTVLKGLNYLKSGTDPVAMEDHEYPAWLWDILKKEEKEIAGGVAEGDLFAKSKKQRRIAAKALRRQQLLHPEMLIPKIPVYEQSVDLPAGDGTPKGSLQAEEVRGELTKSMRDKRRDQIKEANFLKSMR